MTTFQRIIKYIAIAFGTFLSINIILAICFAITIVIGIMSHTSGEKIKNEHSLTNNIEFSQSYDEYESITNIDIETAISKLKILKGTEFKVESSKQISIKQKGTTLEIKEEFKYKNEIPEIIIYIPNELNKFKLEAGSGEVTIEDITANEIDIEIGAGTLNAKNIIAKSKSDIDGGAGKVIIESAVLNNLNLDTGIGEFELNGQIIGNGNIDVGIGKLTINLSDNDYKIYVKKGIGKFTIDGNDAKDGTTIGTGNNELNIDSGIGSVEVNLNV